MDFFTASELMTSLVSVLGAGMLFLQLTTTRAPKALHAEIALRVERSVELLESCKGSRGR